MKQLITLAILTVCLACSALAADIEVTTFNDEFGGGTACSLREAIEAANRDDRFGGCKKGEGVDNIFLSEGFYQLTLGAGVEAGNANRDLDVLSDLNITGAGAGATSILWSREGSFDRVLEMTGAVVRLSNLSIFHGDAGSGNGGGILVERGTLTLDHAAILQSQAGNGGGIYNDGSTLVIRNATIRNNIAQLNGGGIYNTGSLTLETSTINGNTAGVNGGGLWMGTATNAAEISNSTFFGNQADDYGGGLLQSGGSARLAFVTLTQNSVQEAMGGGGGIYRFWGGDLSMGNSIVAVNTLNGSLALTRSDCAGAALTSLGYNIIGNPLGCSFRFEATDQMGGDAPLNPFSSEPLLENNGGPTNTVSLPADSVAINKGGAAVPAVPEDQRGLTRDSNPDSGAYEVVCGDGDLAGNEACDDGEANSDTLANACRTSCVRAACGDGVVDAGEGCDDGNSVETDACRNSCRLSTCRDGIVQAGEDCDDDNRDETDSCLSTCVAASCGDGFVQAGVEVCDGEGCEEDCSGLQEVAVIPTVGPQPDAPVVPDGGGNGGGGGTGGGGGNGGAAPGGGGGCSLIIPKSNSPK